MPEPTAEQVAAGRQIAYRIRAELVCCNIFGRINDTHEVPYGQYRGHDLCYWGEAAARIAETPGQWQNDPADHDWSGPDAVQRRARRQEGGR